jgi:hypothetical protein
VAASFGKEMKIRRRLSKIYNCSREDFASSPLYADYCEEAEDIAYRLIKGESALEEVIKAYKLAHHADIVARNQRHEAALRRERDQHISEARAAAEVQWLTLFIIIIIFS